ncbi:MAG: methyltransferase domain-containing protein [Gammaproteobacteria bacterium]|nr:methyltransferase domain-containing protein [Gammaproteobacteria bacterium]
MDVHAAVMERYSAGARERQSSLCCPVNYDPALLAALPQEILDKDYGCGDPSRYVRAGDRVLDLGSGAGKICYIAAQLVGEAGRVIGVDMNPQMLALARKYLPEMTARLGGDRVEFRRARIEDLALDLDALDARLAQAPVTDAAGLAALETWIAAQRCSHPLVADGSIDLVVSNCVLNLVAHDARRRLVAEIYRVLAPGGRVAIADIVADEPVPEHLKADPGLWSGCISGAFVEDEFVRVFEQAGFLGVTIDQWSPEPWQVVDGIELRSVTLTAVKGSGEACLDYGHAAIYRGPFRSVTDDEGHVFARGERMAVCARTYRLLGAEPYGAHFITVAPAVPGEPRPWCAPAGTRRPAAATKGAPHSFGRVDGPACCGPGDCC